MSRAERRGLVEREAPALPISRQCRLLAVSRASVYRQPAEISEEDCTIMALIDRQYLARPYYGSRRMAAWLATQGHVVNRKRVQRLMRLAGLVAIYQRPNTSKPAVAHKIYPYLLGRLSIERVNQVWCADVTYIPMAKGFLYLVVIMDWVSRAVLAWRLSNTLGAEFCVEALEQALSQYGRPEIFNTDQGSQFTSDDFTDTLKRHAITISMDGKGRYMDNIFVERLWRSLKYEEVYLNAYASVAEAKAGIGSWLGFYNEERQHQSLGYRTPRQSYEAECPWFAAVPVGMWAKAQPVGEADHPHIRAGSTSFTPTRRGCDLRRRPRNHPSRCPRWALMQWRSAVDTRTSNEEILEATELATWVGRARIDNEQYDGPTSMERLEAHHDRMDKLARVHTRLPEQIMLDAALAAERLQPAAP